LALFHHLSELRSLIGIEAIHGLLARALHLFGRRMLGRRLQRSNRFLA
jgi:hypothetical protein